MNIKNTKAFHKHVLKCWPNEAVGFVVNDKFVAVENIAADPINDFEVAQDDYLKYDNIQAIVHSHCYQHELHQAKHKDIDRRAPSHQDFVGQLATGVAWGVVACDGENVTDTLWFGDQAPPVDLYGRAFIHSVYDCFTLIRDYYKQHNVFLDPFPRNPHWMVDNEKLYEDNWQAQGFQPVSADEIAVGDMVYFRFATSYVNHAGVYLGDDKFLHHAFGRLSGEDSLSRWHKQIAMVLRHPHFIS